MALLDVERTGAVDVMANTCRRPCLRPVEPPAETAIARLDTLRRSIASAREADPTNAALVLLDELAASAIPAATEEIRRLEADTNAGHEALAELRSQLRRRVA